MVNYFNCFGFVIRYFDGVKQIKEQVYIGLWMTAVECWVDLASWVVVHVYFVRAFDINFIEVVLYASFHFLQDHLVQYLNFSACCYFTSHHVTTVVLYTFNYLIIFTTVAAYN
jgi:hypothetical protein